MGSFSTQDTVAAAVGLRTQADWRKYIEVIRRNTPAYWRRHSEFESVANECLAEAIRMFEPGKGVPFDGFLAHVAGRRVPEVLRRFDRGEDWASTDEDDVREYLDLRGDQPDDVAPQRHDPIAEVDSMDAVVRFAATLPAADRETAVLLAHGLRATEVARWRGVGRSAVSNAIARIQAMAEILRAA